MWMCWKQSFCVAGLALLIVLAGCGKIYDEEVVHSDFTLEAGTRIEVTPTTVLSAVTDQPGKLFTATLSQPIRQQGSVLAPIGSPVVGRILEAGSAGLTLELTELTVSGGQNFSIKTEPLYYAGSGDAPESTTSEPAVALGDTELTFRLAEPVTVNTAVVQNEVS